MVVDSDECILRFRALYEPDVVWVLCADAGYMLLDGFAEFVVDSLANIGWEGRDYAIAVVEHSLWEFVSGLGVVLHDQHVHAEAAVDADRSADAFDIVVGVVAADLQGRVGALERITRVLAREVFLDLFDV